MINAHFRTRRKATPHKRQTKEKVGWESGASKKKASRNQVSAVDNTRLYSEKQ